MLCLEHSLSVPPFSWLVKEILSPKLPLLSEPEFTVLSLFIRLYTHASTTDV